MLACPSRLLLVWQVDYLVCSQATGTPDLLYLGGFRDLDLVGRLGIRLGLGFLCSCLALGGRAGRDLRPCFLGGFLLPALSTSCLEVLDHLGSAPEDLGYVC